VIQCPKPAKSRRSAATAAKGFPIGAAKKGHEKGVDQAA